jgi:hypothetical protein
MKLFFYLILFISYLALISSLFYMIFKKNKMLSIALLTVGLFFLLILYRNKSFIYKSLKSFDLSFKNITFKKNCQTSVYTIDVKKDNYFDLHLPHAIKSTNNRYIKNQKILKKYLKQGTLVKIHENDGFYINHLYQSSKHLTPLAYKRLIELGKLFRSYIELESEKKSYFTLSSVTRDETQQKEVQKSNPKTASKSISTHSYGVSFDISSIISKNKNCDHCFIALSKALTKMQTEGKILICSESVCIHITVIK